MADNVTQLYGKVLFRPGAVDAVRSLIEKGHDIEAADNADGWSVLHYALVVLRNPDLEVVRLLLNHGANPNRPDRHGWTPLHFAARSGERTVLASLLEAGADPNLGDESGITALHRYLFEGKGKTRRDLDIVRCFLDHGARPTPSLLKFISAVVFENKAEVLRLLSG